MTDNKINPIWKFKNKLVSNVRKREVDELTEQNKYYTNTESLTRLNEFLRGISERFRGIKFAESYNGEHIYLYYPDDLFIRGYVSFTDVRDWGIRSQDENKNTFNVYTPFIRNEKTDCYNPDVYFRLCSINVKTALRNVSKYLRPYTPVEILQATMEDFTDTREQVNSNFAHEVNKKSYDAFGESIRGKLEKELIQLAESGYQFGQFEQEKVMSWVKAHNDAQNIKRIGVKCTMLYIKTSNGEQEFITCPLDDVDTYRSSRKMIRYEAHQNLASRIQTSKELPDDLLSQVAVLMPAKDKQCLESIGYKHCEELYYVYTDNV